MRSVAAPMATLALRVVAFHGSAGAALLALVRVLVDTNEQRLEQEPPAFLTPIDPYEDDDSAAVSASMRDSTFHFILDLND